MAEVWRCNDVTIGREVALKRLISDKPVAKERFLSEAQITGQLEHPAIVPVHDVGFDDNGQPFYIMKFVRGATLKAAIDEFHSSAEKATESYSARQIGRVRLLKIFIDLCHAVAYAHSRGVIHRDLKPDNIMLGPFGETVVLDWGLAKISGEPERGDGGGGVSSSVHPASSGHSAQTLDGSILGSPLYMPPEMAEGRTTDADQRTDVYLLGATLYEMLTGRPPRQGASRDEILEMARTTPPLPPRKLVLDTPRALEAICLKAMSRGRSSRYPTAMAMTEDVQRYLAGETVSAYSDPLWSRGWRWFKRHRRLVGRAVAACTFAGVVALSVVLYCQRSAALNREAARERVKAIRSLVDEARFYGASVDAPNEIAPYYDPTRGQQRAQEALAAAAQWGPRLEGLPLADLRQPMQRELGELCLVLAQQHVGRGRADDDKEAVSLLDRFDQLNGGPSAASKRLRAQVAGASSESVKLAVGTATAQELFLDGERERLASDMVSVLTDPAARQRRVESLRRASERYEAAVRADPSHYWSHLQLGRCYLALGRGPEAAAVLETCIALRPDVPWGYAARGLALALQRRFDAAASDLDRALAIDPKCLAARLNKGVAYLLQDLPGPAAAEFDVLLAQPTAPAEAAFYRSRICLEEGRYDQALAYLDNFRADSAHSQLLAVLRARINLLHGQPSQALADLDGVAGTRDQRGHLLRLIASELPAGRQKLALELALADLAAPTSPAAMADRAAVLHLLGRREEALSAYSRAIAAAPEDAQTIVNRGWTYESLDRLEDARRDFAKALSVEPSQVEAMTGLGYVEARLGHIADAQAQASVAILQSAGDYRILHNAACIYGQLSVTDPQRAAVHQDTAMQLLGRAVEAWHQSWSGHSEIDLIRDESAFPPSMRQRADFKALIGKQSDTPKEGGSRV
jgi:tetratricopeptide (TPR) repeat protein